jgi:hypothetical protein
LFSFFIIVIIPKVELEILWEMATGSLLADLISGYAKLANRFNYNLIAGMKLTHF